MNRYSLSNQALSELDDIWSYIAQDNPEAAERWIAKLLDAWRMLVAPLRGCGLFLAATQDCVR